MLKNEIELIRKKNRQNFRGTIDYEENGKVVSCLESTKLTRNFFASSDERLVGRASSPRQIDL